ncbi:hypothetical protein U1Q18_052619 [Sarracenia purpurea var. burkii]
MVSRSWLEVRRTRGHEVGWVVVRSTPGIWREQLCSSSNCRAGRCCLDGRRVRCGRR